MIEIVATRIAIAALTHTGPDATDAPPIQRPSAPIEVVTPAEPTAEPEPAQPEPAQPEPSAPAPDPALVPMSVAPADPPPPAENEPPDDRPLRATDRRAFLSFNVGGSTRPDMGDEFGYGSNGLDFQLEATVGGHSRRRPRLGGGLVLQYRRGFISEISLAGRVVWDKQLSKRHAIYSSTDITLGMNVPIAFAGMLEPSIPNALIGVGWGVKVIVCERLLLHFRPFAPNLVAPSFFSALPVRLRWDVGVGIGVVW